MRHGSYFISYLTSIDAANDNLPNVTQIHNGYHV